MKAFCALKAATGAVFAAIALEAAAFAQQLDNPAHYTVTMQSLIFANDQPLNGGINAYLSDATGVVCTSTVGGLPPAGSNVLAAPIVTAKLVPNKEYVLSVTGGYAYQGSVVFRLIDAAGLRIMVDQVRTDTVGPFSLGVSAPVGYTYKVMLVPVGTGPLSGVTGDLRGGEASSLVIDKPIWYVGLGKLRSGATAGAVGFRYANFANPANPADLDSFYTPAALNYDPTDETEVNVVREGGILRQVFSREVLLDIQTISSTSYRLDVYPRAQVTAKTGGLWTFTGSPFVSYVVSRIGTGSGVRITRTEDNITWETSLTYSGSAWQRRDWHLQTGAPDSYVTTTFSSEFDATVSHTGPGASGQETPLSSTKTFANYAWGNELVATSTGELSTGYEYHESTGAWGGYAGKLEWTIDTTGRWTRYRYYDAPGWTGPAVGAPKEVLEPWLSDSPVAPQDATPANSVSTTYAYYSNNPDLPTSRISTAPGGHLLSKTTWEYTWDYVSLLNGYPVKTTTQSDFYTSANSVTTVRKAYAVDASVPLRFQDQPVCVAYPDGRKDSYAYFEGSWNASSQTFAGALGSDDRLILVFHGQTTAGSQSPAGVSVASWSNGYSRAMDPVFLVAGLSTVSQIVIDTTGRTVFSGEALYVGPGSLTLLSGTVFTYDDHGRLTTETDAVRSAAVTSRTYHASLPDTVTGPDGVVTKYEYDALLRLFRKTEGYGGGSAYPAKVHETVFDGANRPFQAYSCDCGTSPTEYAYDSSNRLQSKKDPSPSGAYLTTSYSYPSPLSTTTTFPSGATRTEETYRDGRSKSVTGTAQPASYYGYTANDTGLLVTYYAADSASKANGWSETQSDLLGRVKTYSTPAYGWTSSNASAVVDIESTYGPTSGLLTKQTTSLRSTAAKLAPDRLFVYDAAGRVQTEGYDLNGDGNLTGSSNDRVIVHGYGFESDGGWWTFATTATYPALNSSTLVQTGKTKSRLTGFASGQIAETIQFDANNQVSSRTISVSPSQKRTTTTLSAPGALTEQITQNGYDGEVHLAAGDRVQRLYDSRGRLQYVKSRWNGSSYGATDSYLYYGDTSYVQSQTVAGVTTQYAYAWGGGTQVVSTTDAAGTTYAVYNAQGLTWRTYGSGATPTEVQYDERGRRTSLTTWSAGSFTGTSWPASPGSGDLTQWALQPATGLVERKTYADNNHVDFTYTALGQLKTRTWARGITTTYDYYDGSTTGSGEVSHRTQELKSITYSDSTTGVIYSYYRSGLMAGVADATGSRVFSPGATQPFQIEQETLGSFYNRGTMSRVRTLTYDSARRSTGFKLGTAVDDDVDLAQTRSYGAATGLLENVYSASNNGTARTIAYAYQSGSSLLDHYGTGLFAMTYAYDATSAARRSLLNAGWNGSPRTMFELQYDDRGLLRSAKQSGSAFADYTSGTGYSSVYNFHSYDGRGQLQTTAMYRNSPPTSGSPASDDELPGRRFEYRYDLMGNRTTTGPTGSAGGGDDEYTLKSNGLNQYDTKENNTVRVLGTAAANAKVGAQSADSGRAAVALTTNKKDRSFAADVVPLNNTSGPAKGTVTAYAAIPGSGGAPDVVQTSPVRPWQIGRQLQSFTYDLDGNLTRDGVWTYDYDAENRLIRMASTTEAVAAGLPNQVLEFKYDYMGRRVQKRSNNVTAGTDVYTRYVYDGWNVVAEFEATANSVGTMLRSFTWGLDVADSLGSTGGVGALVQLTDHVNGKTYFPTYDGSGNVSSLVDSADGTVAMLYEYSPFGELLRSEVNSNLAAGAKTYLAAQPFRFSTKFTDAESGLSYYGYRYYSPGLGRFINRDPIEEQGGVNLYGLVGNNPTTQVDFLGLYWEWQCHEEERGWSGMGQYGPAYGVQIFKKCEYVEIPDQYATPSSRGSTGSTSGGQASSNTGSTSSGNGSGSQTTANAAPNSLLGGRPEIVTEDMLIRSPGPDGSVFGTDPWTGKTVILKAAPGMSDGTADIAGLLLTPPFVKQALGAIMGMLSRATEREGGLVIGKLDDLANSTGWRTGDHTLHLPPRPPGPGRWEQNARELQNAINQGRPIRDISPTQGGGFLERERQLLQQNGWKFDPQTSLWSPGG